MQWNQAILDSFLLRKKGCAVFYWGVTFRVTCRVTPFNFDKWNLTFWAMVQIHMSLESANKSIKFKSVLKQDLEMVWATHKSLLGWANDSKKYSKPQQAWCSFVQSYQLHFIANCDPYLSRSSTYRTVLISLPDSIDSLTGANWRHL